MTTVDNRRNGVNYRALFELAALLPWRMPQLPHQKELLRLIFGGLPDPDEHSAIPDFSTKSEPAEHEGIVLLPLWSAVGDGTWQLPRDLCHQAQVNGLAQLEQWFAASGIHFENHLDMPDASALMLHHRGDVENYRWLWQDDGTVFTAAHVQTGAAYPGLSATDARANMEMYPEAGYTTWPMCPLHALTVLALMIQTHGDNVPNLWTNCGAFGYEPDPRKRDDLTDHNYRDCPRVEWHPEQRTVVLDWNWDNRARSIVGNASVFVPCD